MTHIYITGSSFNEAADLSPRIAASLSTIRRCYAGFNEAADLSPRIGPDCTHHSKARGGLQ